MQFTPVQSQFLVRERCTSCVLSICLLLLYVFYAMQVCPSTGRPCDCSAGQAADSGKTHTSTNAVQHSSDDKLACGGSAGYSKATAEPLFPAELKRHPAKELHIPGPLAHWYR